MTGYISETKALIAGREEEIIHVLGIVLPKDGAHCRCPLPSHDDRNPSWRWDCRQARSHCTCEEGRGDVLDLIMHMRGCTDLRAAADWARQALGLPGRNGRTETPAERRAREVRVVEARPTSRRAAGCSRS